MTSRQPPFKMPKSNAQCAFKAKKKKGTRNQQPAQPKQEKSIFPLARYLLGLIRQNAYSFHHQLPLPRCLRSRLVRRQTLWIYSRNNHCIDAYRLFLATTSIKLLYIRTLRTDQGEKYANHRTQTLIEEHLTNHVVCAKDEHYSVRAAETVVNNLRHSTRAMMLHGNISKRIFGTSSSHMPHIFTMWYHHHAPTNLKQFSNYCSTRRLT